jgi:hypothetical protein
VPIVHQNDIPRVIAEKGMAYVPYQKPAPPTQWINEEGRLAWFARGIGKEGWEELPPAATYPGELHLQTSGLGRATSRTSPERGTCSGSPLIRSLSLSSP